ncbi:MAG: hypothetical protein ACOZAO_01375 [Patescibacteria group bacterium]
MKKSLMLTMIMLLLVACSATAKVEPTPQATITPTKQPPTSIPMAANAFSTISTEVGAITVTVNDIEFVAVSVEEVIKIVGQENFNNYVFTDNGVPYILADGDGCGPSRLEMINAFKDEAYNQNVPWNKIGSMILVESGFNAMRYQNGVCETIKNYKSGATCMGQFIYTYHSHRNWPLLENANGSYEGHLWCANQATSYLVEEMRGGLGQGRNAWPGWDNTWDAAIWRYKGCDHPSTKYADGRGDCHVVHENELRGGFIDESSGEYVSLAAEAVNDCWNFETNEWQTIDRNQGQTCLALNDFVRTDQQG